MARQEYSINGTIGNIIFYKYNGKPVARSKPARVRQTAATKKSSKDFARAVGFSKELRRELWPLINVYHDKKLMYRMNTILLQWLTNSKGDEMLLSENIQSLIGLELNEQALYSRRIKFNPVISFDQPGKILVHLPALNPASDFMRPDDAARIELVLLTARCNTDPHPSRLFFSQSKKEILINPHDPIIAAQTIELPIETITKDIVLVAMGVNFIIGDGLSEFKLTDKTWLTGKLIGAMWKV